MSVPRRVVHVGVPCVLLRGAIATLAIPLVLFSGARSARAQEVAPDAVPPAHVAVADGEVAIDRDAEDVDAAPGEPIVPGDRIRTGAGRAQVWLPDGSTLALDEHTTADLLSEWLIRLTAGRLYLTAAPADGGSRRFEPYRVDTPHGSATIDGPGEYLVAVDADRGLDVAVFRGGASLLGDGGVLSLRSGERAEARSGAPLPGPQRFNSARPDPFERWAASVQDARRGRAASSQYLPDNLRTYGRLLDESGSWEYDAAYGYVWYPTVSTGWRPYYYGRWRPLPRYGWTWIGTDRWGWPTHHYGRWGHARARWFWIPDRRWAPAWVSWASAADYVSWCPLGVDNRPVFSFSLTAGQAWNGWVVLPRQVFGARDGYVARHAFDGRRLSGASAFALHAQAPLPPRTARDRVDRRPAGLDAGRRSGWDDRPTPSPPGGRPERRPEAAGTPSADRRFEAGGREWPRGPRSDDGWRAPWPAVAVPRGGDRPVPRDSDRVMGIIPNDEDRPTPAAPRAGIRVDPGVPRAGDRFNPYAPSPPADAPPTRRGRDRDNAAPGASPGPRDHGTRESSGSRERGTREVMPPPTPAPSGMPARGEDGGTRAVPRSGPRSDGDGHPANGIRGERGHQRRGR